MQYYFAPMEGITTSVYRNLHRRFFPGVDKYYTPFISPVGAHVFSRRDLREILPDCNEGVPVVPQLLTKDAGDFLWAVGELAAMGYEEVNLNLGCPSGTVVAKGRGSGMLADQEELQRFLDRVFSGVRSVEISIKTRLGISDPDAFPALLALFNQYPVAELTVHPRVQKDFYRNSVNLQAFALAVRDSRNPLCYNGDLRTVADCRQFQERFPTVPAAMLGRGLVTNPALAAQCQGGEAADWQTLRNFHDALYDAYCRQYQSRENAVMRMKELWSYMISAFPNSEGNWKRLRKASRADPYERAVQSLFAEAMDGGVPCSGERNL